MHSPAYQLLHTALRRLNTRAVRPQLRRPPPDLHSSGSDSHGWASDCEERAQGLRERPTLRRKQEGEGLRKRYAVRRLGSPRQHAITLQTLPQFGTVHVRARGSSVTVTNDRKETVRTRGTVLLITATYSLAFRTKGLCGTFNNNWRGAPVAHPASPCCQHISRSCRSQIFPLQMTGRTTREGGGRSARVDGPTIGSRQVIHASRNGD